MRLARGGAAPVGFNPENEKQLNEHLVRWRDEAMRMRPGEGKHRVVAFGDGDFPAGYRKNRSVPRKALLRLLMHASTVLLVDEYNTTKMCPTCHTPLQHVKVQRLQHDKSWKTVTSHDLRRCGNREPGGCARLGDSWKNRDEAASLNIGRCARVNALRADHDVRSRPPFLRRRAPGDQRHPDKTNFICRPVNPVTQTPKKIGRGA